MYLLNHPEIEFNFTDCSEATPTAPGHLFSLLGPGLEGRLDRSPRMTAAHVPAATLGMTNI